MNTLDYYVQAYTKRNPTAPSEMVRKFAENAHKAEQVCRGAAKNVLEYEWFGFINALLATDYGDKFVARANKRLIEGALGHLLLIEQVRLQEAEIRNLRARISVLQDKLDAKAS